MEKSPKNAAIGNDEIETKGSVSKSEQRRRAVSRGRTEADEVKEQRYFFPQHGVSVVAESQEEAEKELQKIINKK